MNKILIALLSLIIASCSCQALTLDDTRVEFRTAAFFPSSKLYRNIYGNTNLDIQLQASTRFLCQFETFGNLAWLSKHGQSIGFKDPTRIDILNCSLGINYLYDWNCKTTLYAGAGFCGARVWVKNKLHFDGHHKESKSIVGGVAKAGVYYSFTDYLFVDLFVDYVYLPSHFKTHAQLGGVKTGAGIGLMF